MVAKTVTGERVIVELPWKGITDNQPQYTRVKKPVAQLLKFKIKNTSDMYFEQEFSEKDKSPTEKVGGKQKAKVPRRGGYRQRSIKIIFKNNKIIGKQSFASVNFPVTTSCSVLEMIKYFETGEGKSLGVTRLVTDKGQTYPINSGV